MILNLTPHPMNIYPADTPDEIDPATREPRMVIFPNGGTPARLGEKIHGPASYVLAYDEDPASRLDLIDITFGGDDGLPPPQRGVWLLVSRPVAMVSSHRADLLVPHLPVRDMDGRTLGCRQLARPVW